MSSRKRTNDQVSDLIETKGKENSERFRSSFILQWLAFGRFLLDEISHRQQVLDYRDRESSLQTVCSPDIFPSHRSDLVFDMQIFDHDWSVAFDRQYHGEIVSYLDYREISVYPTEKTLRR